MTVVPERVGRFELRGPLAESKGLRRWEGFDPQLRRAVTVVRLEGGDANARRERLRALARLTHPVVPRVLEVIPDGDRDWVVLEGSSGPPLSELAAGPGVPAAEAAQIGADLAAAVAEAAGVGIELGIDAGRLVLTPTGHVRLAEPDLSGASAGEGDLATLGKLLEGLARGRRPEGFTTALRRCAASESGNSAGAHEVATLLRRVRVELDRQRHRRVRLRPWALGAGAVLALAGALLAVLPYVRGPVRRSVAVLPPLVASSSNSTSSLLHEAVSDALTATLLRLDGLSVASPREVQEARDVGLARSAELARALGVSSMLESSVAEGAAGRTVRVSLGLTRAESGRLEWSETFDVPSATLVGLQERVGEEARRLFPGHSELPDVAPRRCSERALRSYLGVRVALELGRATPSRTAELGAIQESRKEAPRFVEPILTACSIERGLYARDGDESHLRTVSALLGEADAVAPRDPRILRQRIVLAGLRGQTQDALAVARVLEAQRPWDATALRELGETLAATGQWEEAVDVFKRSCAIRPAFALLCRLGDAELNEGEVGAARRTLLRVLGVAPNHPGALAGLVRVELADGQLDRALEAANALVSARGSAGDRYLLGLVHLYRREDRAAAAVFDESARLAPVGAENAALRAVAAAWSGSPSARELFVQALALAEHPREAETAELVALRAVCRLRLGQPQLALADARRAAALAPFDPLALWAASMAARACGDLKDATEYGSRAREVGIPPTWDLPEQEGVANVAPARLLGSRSR